MSLQVFPLSRAELAHISSLKGAEANQALESCRAPSSCILQPSRGTVSDQETAQVDLFYAVHDQQRFSATVVNDYGERQGKMVPRSLPLRTLGHGGGNKEPALF